MSKKLKLLAHCGKNVFDNAIVDSIIILLSMNSERASICKFSNQSNEVCNIPLSELTEPYYFDYLFTPFVNIIIKIEENSNMLLSPNKNSTEI